LRQTAAFSRQACSDLTLNLKHKIFFIVYLPTPTRVDVNQFYLCTRKSENMTKTIYFDKLKFIKTDYRFRSKKHRERYFIRVLIDNAYEYRRQFKEYMNERLNVICTWQETIKYAAFVALAVALFLLGFGAELRTLIIIFGVSILLIIDAVLLEMYFNRYAQSINITNLFMDMDDVLYGAQNIAMEEEYGIRINNY
jgi:hypothetical protein